MSKGLFWQIDRVLSDATTPRQILLYGQYHIVSSCKYYNIELTLRCLKAVNTSEDYTK